MSANRRFATVAVAGPLRRTFTYHLADDMPDPAPGQRLLVEFGRARKLGFYLGRPQQDPRIPTKAVKRIVDRRSYFSGELFECCMWMADYYFANPADVLASALPPALKATSTPALFWVPEAADQLTQLPQNLRNRIRISAKLTPSVVGAIEKSGLLLPQLLQDGHIREEWPEQSAAQVSIVTGYRAEPGADWDGFFRRRKTKLDPFEGELPVARLAESGWTSQLLRAAVTKGVLAPVTHNRRDDILSFVTGRAGLTELTLTDEQAAAVGAVEAALSGGFKGFLLHGVTGSGKTLVYCQLASRALSAGKSVLVLTPEIALSGATLAYFRGFFGDRVTVIHSAMTPRERLESWRGILSGRYRIVVGPRSAVFAPMKDLGLIIVDEEHDGSYKQDEPAPRFHGRDAAVMRAKLAGVPVVLGSASPSIESYHNARESRYQLLEITRRPAGARLPKVRMVDLRRERLHGDLPYLSYPLKKEVDARLERNEQVILFLNRRGYSPQLKCGDCGHVPLCPHCEIKLTYHKAGHRLTCHYCGFFRQRYDRCEKCGGADFRYPGVGTQKVEEHIARLFPDAKVLRFDSDSARGRRNAHDLLREFSEGNYQLLLGTQMVTKGLDLPGVSLVGVLSADQGLDFPDFRANEKTFARLLQVAGRSGRGAHLGEVLIQTTYPDSPVIDDAARQDYKTFFEREIASRREFKYPPFCRLIRFVFSSDDVDSLERAVDEFVVVMARRLRDSGLGFDSMGPAPCAVALLRGNHRRHLIVKTKDSVTFGRVLTGWESESTRFGLPSKVRVAVDVDPDDMM